MAPVLAEQLLAPQTFCTSSASVARSEISQCFFYFGGEILEPCCSCNTHTGEHTALSSFPPALLWGCII